MDFKEAKDLHIKADGTFELILSSKRPKGARNWLRTASDPVEGLFIIRQTFLDADNEVPADISIELFGEIPIVAANGATLCHLLSFSLCTFTRVSSH